MRRLFARSGRVKPSYGIDSPQIVRNLFLAGSCAIAAGAFVPVFHAGEIKISLIGPTLLALGCLSLGLCASVLAYSYAGKFNIRNRMLGMVKWRGDEAVLDIGTGRGLVAIGAAKRLRNGTVTGIDAWDSDTFDVAQRNVEIEGVADRVELISADARNIGFVDNSFDAVLSLSGLQKLDAGGREAACREIARVLKPRGIAIVADNSQAASCARALHAAGLVVQGPKSYTIEAYTALAIVVGRKRAPGR